MVEPALRRRAMPAISISAIAPRPKVTTDAGSGVEVTGLAENVVSSTAVNGFNAPAVTLNGVGDTSIASKEKLPPVVDKPALLNNVVGL